MWGQGYWLYFTDEKIEAHKTHCEFMFVLFEGLHLWSQRQKEPTILKDCGSSLKAAGRQVAEVVWYLWYWHYYPILLMSPEYPRQ